MFWVLFVRKYFKLPKFIQKHDLNARMLRIFSDLRDKSALYIWYVISRNKLTGLGKGYSTYYHTIEVKINAKHFYIKEQKVT